MPELPEVQTVVDTLGPALVGSRISRIDHIRDDIVSPVGFDLRTAIGRHVVRSVTRRAKRIVITLDDGNAFYFHLGMSGRLTVEADNTEIQKHTHFVADIGAGRQLRFKDPRRFGGIFWLGQNHASANDSALGPEPLTTSAKRLGKQLKRTRRNIKAALLDQKLIAGLGNIYVDESLFVARVHPLRTANELSEAEVRSLSSAIKRVLKKALKHRGSTLRDYVDANGGAGAFQKLHSVYDRAGKPCRSCKTPITRIVIGGRSTHFCGRCQRRTHRANK